MTQSLRDHLAAALDAARPDIAPRLEHDADAHLELVALAREAQGEAGVLLQAAVDSARGAGCTWEQVGGVLGMSRQAAQQRYGRRDDDAPAPGVRTTTLSPLSAFTEMRVLERAGRYGWHSIGYGALYHVVEWSEVQWEHTRRTVLAGPPPGAGWQGVGRGWGWWTYWARPTDRPAEPGPVDLRELMR